MTELSFGKIYTLPMPGCSNNVPLVSMSAMPTGTIGVAEMALPRSQVEAIYMSDDEGAREFAIWDGTNLKEYDVILGYGTGTVSFSSGSVTSAPADMTLPSTSFYPFGLKKENSLLYNAYYVDYGTNEVHKVSIVPGVGGTDSIILTIPTEHVLGVSSVKIGHECYIGALIYWNGWDGHTTYHSYVGVEIYSINIETGAVVHDTSFSRHGELTNTDPDGPFPPDNDKLIGTLYSVAGTSTGPAMVQSSGQIIWACGYSKAEYGLSETFLVHYYSVVNEEEIVFYEVDDVSTVPAISFIGETYNSNDYYLAWYGTAHGSLAWSRLIFNGSSIPYKLVEDGAYLPLSPLITLISKSTFPGVSWEAPGITEIWIDTTTGLKTTNIALSVNAVCSTLDSITGNVYMFASGSKLLAVEANTNTITREWLVYPSLVTPIIARNHGNFFVAGGGASYEIMYIENIKHFCHQMIIEMN